MGSKNPPKNIAIFNDNEGLLNLLNTILQTHGLNVSEGYIQDLNSGKIDFKKFLEENDPDTIIWDIAYPYQENWDYFKSIKNLKESEGRRFIIISTDRDKLNTTSKGEIKQFPLIEKPFSIDHLENVIFDKPEINEESERPSGPELPSGRRGERGF